MNKAAWLFVMFASILSLFAQQDEKSQSLPAGTNTPAQKGIKFFQGTWSELLTESQKTGKPIFLDAYAAWCAPCRMMATNTFTDAEVGTFFNEHFVNYKLDMEKGEGPAISMKYRVTHYPTYLFLDAAGNLKYRTMGYMIPDMFIQEGKKAVESFKNSD
ncbi:MAG TPA: thioredoxin family protein [Chitinophagales bacterium]|nr:thioredoxin family protein [Chitinophagales bacterium]